MSSSKTILITTLAEYQTRFWIPVAQRLRASGCEVELLAFDDRSAEMAAAAGVPVTNMYREGIKAGPSPDERAAFDARIEAYGLDGSNFLFSHERFTFGICDSAALRRRFMIYANAMEALLDRLAGQGKHAVLVQELGGFLSVISSFYAAKRRGIRNWFIEPSFFRGRMYFTPDSLAAPQVMARPADEVSPEVRSYLDDTLKQQAIVIPKKDQHHYSAAFKKVVNLRNSRRFAEKLWDQFALGKHQEFGHNLRHARVHAAMALNATRLRKLYKPIPGAPFVYYPFHVPADMALTLRSPDYLDQVATVDFLLRTIPDSHVLVVKEHPAQIGAISADRLFELARRFDNFVLLPPQTNNYTVLNRADAVISVNSKSGAEALLLGKPVVVMGDAFYRSCPLVYAVDRLADVPARLRQALSAGPFDPAKGAPYFESAWRKSFPGELYIGDPSLLDTFAASLRAAIAESARAN
ncbi:capsule biosynthesis protein [Bradyrhizobium liaoningense]|uniref:capsular polysaccharide export protein, LipB/KpsS family n=1 Tax=Bradyrhizobium sp. TaxID=376 RepID=UPI00077E1763|nr:capsule biosynthesis protein [Bradyrhizobium sp.]KYK46034.1 capsule biosynthesis protein [Bradyrhizobium liaoningense]MDX3967622.1 capsule biosynthesis protein [Bradyrhizobium sp.]